MSTERSRARFPRILRLAEKLRSFKYRHSYVGAHIRQFLARQMREMRGDISQAEFGAKIGKPQNVISRLEDPAYGKWTLSTLLEIAEKLDKALVVRFVDFPTFLKATDDQSDFAAAPPSYDQATVDEFAWSIAQQQTVAIGKGIYLPPLGADFVVMNPQKYSDIPIFAGEAETRATEATVRIH
jgi:hypothetical protein